MQLEIKEKLQILKSISEIPNNSSIAIYGNGIIGKAFKNLIEKERKDIKINFFINSNNRGETDNLEVVLFSDIETKLNSLDIIIICSSHWNEIENSMLKINIKSLIISNEIIYNISELNNLGSFRFNQTETSNIKKRLEKLFPYIHHDSLKIYKMLIELRLSENESDFFNYFRHENSFFSKQYLDNIVLRDNSVIIEGGVEDGTDSVNFYNTFNNIILKIYGFEPFIETFDNSKNNSFLIKNGMEVYPWALWNRNENLSFIKNDSSSVSSCINRNENISNDLKHATNVKGITIDKFIEEKNITKVSFIKLDIEGAEFEALEGAKKTIQNHKPQLAICIYHKKEHLFEIPELLLNYYPGYTFRIGLHSPTFIDTVLYAFP